MSATDGDGMNGTPSPFADPAAPYMEFVEGLKARGAYSKGARR